MSSSALLVFLFIIHGSGGTLQDIQDDPGFIYWFTTNNETFENYPLTFSNILPSWIHGTLVRNGPGKFESGPYHFTNALDGYAKLNSWKFDGQNGAFFTTKFLQTRYYKSSIQQDRITPLFTLDSTVPPRSCFARMKCVINQFDNMNVNIYDFNGQHDTVYALTDAWKLYQVNVSNLDTVNHIEPKFVGPSFGWIQVMSSAHPLPEYNKDTHITFLINISLLPWKKSSISLIRVKSVNDRELISEWEIGYVPNIHSFSVTSHYAVLYVGPLFVSIADCLLYGNVVNTFSWKPNKNSTIYVINLSSGDVTTLTSQSMFLLHHANAYEDSEGKVVFDAPSYPNGHFFNALKIDALKNATKRTSGWSEITLVRLVLDLKRHSVNLVTFKDNTKGIFKPSKLTLPTINESYRSKHYCFIYGIFFSSDIRDFTKIAIVKKDLCGQDRDRVHYIPHHYPSEVWFVSSPASVDEDDGYLMSVILNGDRKLSYIALVDAKTLKITHTAYMPTYIPFQTHGRFITD